MLYPLALVALAGLATASPTVQPINFAAILAAATPSLTGPPVTAAVQTGVYNPAAASSAASAAATGVASASAASSLVARDVLEGRSFCFFGFCMGTPTPTTAKTPAAGWPASSTKPAIAAVTSSATPVITSSAAVITAPSTYPCSVQPDGNGPHVEPDTVEAFEAYPEFHQAALTAITPAGYASTFRDLNASVNANSYLGLHTLTSYDVAKCASLCDGDSLCTGINIYVERDPSINPAGCSCNNPASISNYKCTLWGSGVDKAAATNFGEGRESFHVVIAGSNGYEKTNNTTPATPSGWTNPQKCGGAVHNHPATCMGQTFFPGPFDINVCATYAAAQNAKNSKSVGLSSWASWFGYSPLKCNFFNAFMIKENGVAKGTYCSLFTQQYAPSAASYKPEASGGISWGVESSWSFCSA
ncbi:hypothetical protein LZ30DRAFT_593063 [Colletotrichum cereale]|nr:hypothetical protein LZ30DRAFT_593063 [Colletotrichum cereale]